MLELKGIIPALVTPMSPDGGAIDLDALVRHLERLLDAGVAGFLVAGSTGEFAALSHDERTTLLEHVIAVVDRQVPVVAHTGALTTAETEALTAHARQAGAAAVMVLPPHFDALTFPELVAHYERVARAATGMTFVMYHYPAASGVELDPPTLVELCLAAEASYVKDSTGDPAVLTALVHRHGELIRTHIGVDGMLFYGFAAGAPGAISVVANIVPELCVELHDAFGRGDLEHARTTWRRLWPLCHLLDSEPFIAATKAGAALAGSGVGPPRPPLLPLWEDAAGRLRAALDVAGSPSP